MADDKIPNSASRRDQAEGERWSPAQTDEATSSAARDVIERYDDGEGSGIANRPLDEEIENQSGLPERGSAKERDERGGGGRRDPPTTRNREPDDAVRRERPAGENTPRRYDHADDPALPSGDAALGTNI
jgi:hypothetical protein